MHCAVLPALHLPYRRRSHAALQLLKPCVSHCLLKEGGLV